MGRHNVPLTEILHNNKLTTDHSLISDAFADFFSKKVKDLCPDKIDEEIVSAVVKQKPKITLKLGIRKSHKITK